MYYLYYHRKLICLSKFFFFSTPSECKFLYFLLHFDLQVLELLGFQTCIHSYVSNPSVEALSHIIEVVIKTNEKEGRREGKSMVLKLVREHGIFLSDMSSAEISNKAILSSCQSCSNSLLNLFRKARTTRLLAGIGNEEILLTKDIQQLLLQTWFQPLVADYPCLRKLKSFDPKASFLLAWYECFLKDSYKFPDLRNAFQSWCKRTFRYF
ncbi:hypothetical protein MKX01_015386 [Papaver californicum]|nr:hypothetical protein MKX01_015386 [Papaver californicum]